jgi:magnesium-transporting ATPase (P-type)
MTGKELEEYCTLEQDRPITIAKERLALRKRQIVDKLQILARTSPKYNKLLLKILKEDNRIVAATGS